MYQGAPKNRIWLNYGEIAEQLRALGEAWKGIHPNLRRKHMGAAIRKVGLRDVAPVYRNAAKIFELSGKSPRKKRISVSKKTGKIRSVNVNSLRSSVGASKLYPGKPSNSALDMKIGYRMGKKGGSHAMLLARGTAPRYRKGNNSIIKAAERTAAIVAAARRGVEFTVSRTGRLTTASKKLRAISAGYKGRFGYTGFLKPTGLEQFTSSDAARRASPNMAKELREAYRKAVKEQYSEKYLAVMRKYMTKYGNQGLFSIDRGFFQAAR